MVAARSTDEIDVKFYWRQKPNFEEGDDFDTKPRSSVLTSGFLAPSLVGEDVRKRWRVASTVEGPPPSRGAPNAPHLATPEHRSVSVDIGKGKAVWAGSIYDAGAVVRTYKEAASQTFKRGAILAINVATGRVALPAVVATDLLDISTVIAVGNSDRIIGVAMKDATGVTDSLIQVSVIRPGDFLEINLVQGTASPGTDHVSVAADDGATVGLLYDSTAKQWYGHYRHHRAVWQGWRIGYWRWPRCDWRHERQGAGHYLALDAARGSVPRDHLRRPEWAEQTFQARLGVATSHCTQAGNER